jgi:enamine deaminase RidA (YjgF/YER057c/UK114 family)
MEVRTMRPVLFLFVLGALAPARVRPDDKPRDGARQQSRVVVPAQEKAAYDSWGYAPAVVTRDGTIYMSGEIVTLEGKGTYQERYAAGFKRTLTRIGQTLAEAGASLDDVVDITSYHTDLAHGADAPAASILDGHRHDRAGGARRRHRDPGDREAAREELTLTSPP